MSLYVKGNGNAVTVSGRKISRSDLSLESSCWMPWRMDLGSGDLETGDPLSKEAVMLTRNRGRFKSYLGMLCDWL